MFRSCVALCLVAAGYAFATTVAHPAGVLSGGYTTNPDGSNTYTYEVTPEKKNGVLEVIKDFHVWCQVGSKKFKLAGEPGGGKDGWNKNMTGGSGNWGGPTALPGGHPTLFTITVPKGKKIKDCMLYWKSTGDGNTDPDFPPGTPDVDSGPDTNYDDPPKRDEPIHGSVVYADVTGPDTVGQGTTCAIGIDTYEPNSPYQVFALSEDDAEAPSPLTDYNGFLAWCDAHPGPAALTFANMSGNTDANGQSNAPTVTVPNDPGLVGTKFYLLVVVDSETDKVTTGAREVTIQ